MNQEFNHSIEKSISHLSEGTSANGDFNSALKDVYGELISSDLNDSQKVGFMQQLSKTAHENGMFPELVESYVSQNFGDLDLDDNGWVSANEIKEVQKSSLTKESITPMEQQVLRYMSANISDIANGANDETGWENNGISLKDVKGYRTKQQAKRYKSLKATRADSYFGNKKGFKFLDTNGNGFISNRELQEAIQSESPSANNLSTSEFQDLAKFVNRNKKEIYKSANDQKWQVESEITLKDLQQFARDNKYPALNSTVSDAKEFNFKIRPDSSNSIDDSLSIEDTMFQVAIKRFSDLDLNKNGYLTVEEIDKTMTSKRLSASLTNAEERGIKAIKNQINYIQKENNDEWFYENNGVSKTDIEQHAENLKRNAEIIPTKPGDHLVKMKLEGADRQFRMHIPSSYDGSKPMPVVMMLHGILQDSNDIAKQTGLNQLAEQEGFIAIYPDSQGWLGDNIRSWSIGEKYTVRNVDDGNFLKTILDNVETKLNTDKSKVYIAGYSNGGMLAHEMACRFPDRVTAIASINSTMNGCESPPGKPVPVMMLNSTSDKVVPMQGRTFLDGIWPLDMEPSSYAREFWSQNNGAQKIETSRPQKGLVKEVYQGDSCCTDVVSYTLEGGRHVWPGARGDSSRMNREHNEVDATNLMWSFFQDYQRENNPTLMANMNRIDNQ